MTRRIIVIASILLINHSLYSQSLIQDIDSLRELIVIYEPDPSRSSFYKNKDTLQQVAKILHRYLPEDKKSLSTSIDILSYYDANNSYITKYYSTDPTMDNELSSAIEKIKKPISSPSSPFISNLLYGVTDFLIKRAKEELKIAFFDRLKEEFVTKEMEMIFPQSAATFNLIDQDIYDYKVYLSTLQNSFRQDLELLPSHLSSYVRNARFNHFEKDEQSLISHFLDASQELIDTVAFPIILDSLGARSVRSIKEESLAPNSKIWNIRNALGFIRIISNSLIKDDKKENYISPREFKNLIQDTILSNLYFGLVYQRLVTDNLQISNSKNKKLAEIVLEMAPPNNTKDQRTFLNSLRTIIDNGVRIDKLIKELKDKESLPEDSEERTIKLYSFITSSFNIVKGIINVVPHNSMRDTISQGLLVMESAIRIPVHIKRKKTTSAIVDANVVLQYALKSSNKEIARRILKYGSFAASMAAASDPGEIASVIDTYALPVGSYRAKRQDRMNVAFNGYLGIWGGRESVSDDEYKLALVTNNLSDTSTTKWGTGITAPIGITISWSYDKNKSISFFPYFFDLGAIASFRLSDDTTEDLPELNFQNVVAPGFQLSFGIAKTPIALSFGGQYGPGLRKVTLENATIDEVKAFRWTANLTVDIPLATITHKPK